MNAVQRGLFDEPIAVDQSVTSDLRTLLSEDLDFRDETNGRSSHNFHSFPAKYPPQLPAKFIAALTVEGDTVLDPMMGSGTTLVEAYLTNRRGVGFDIDPLAIRLAKVKTTPLDKNEVANIGKGVLVRATSSIEHNYYQLRSELEKAWDEETRRFVDYWFHKDTQIRLRSLIREIEQVSNPDIRSFLEIVFSAIIITKSGGVSLALDLAHTRPHKAKIVIDERGVRISGENGSDASSRDRILTKRLRSPLEEFEKRFIKNLASLPGSTDERYAPHVEQGNAQALALPDDSIDLIVTSPPYASNAIDYMRAHKFSLVWLGYTVSQLGAKRNECIGGESVTDLEFEAMPAFTTDVIREVTSLDVKKGAVLLRYYSEMTRVLRETFRVLRPGKAAIVVVGSSIMRGRDTETGECLADIGRAVGLEVPHIGVRNIDRNHRMMPAGATVDLTSQIQQRMHQEYVIGFVKPDRSTKA